MKVGDMRTERPHFWTTYGHGAGQPTPCEVIWIHPQRRYYRVRFTAPLTGLTWTECYYFADRRGAVEEGNEDYEIDCNHEQQGRRRKDRHRH